MKRIVASVVILSFCVASSFAQTPKPTATAPENFSVGAAKYANKAERDAARKKRKDCKKQAKAQKLGWKASRAFVKSCVAK